MKWAIIPALAALSLLNACAYSIHNVHVGSYEPYTPKSAGSIVTAHAEQFVVMGFVGNTKYVDEAYDSLQEKCPKGELVGVVTESMTDLGFLSWTNHIYLKGLCTSRGKSKRASIDSDEDLVL